MKEDNLKIIYNEISELHHYQQDSVDLLYNKLNWILVSDVVFLAAAYGSRHPNFLAVLLVTISAILVLVRFQPEIFKSTAQISDQLENVDKPAFLESLIKKKKEAYNANSGRIAKMTEMMRYARILLIVALVLQLFSLIPLYLIYGR